MLYFPHQKSNVLKLYLCNPITVFLASQFTGELSVVFPTGLVPTDQTDDVLGPGTLVVLKLIWVYIFSRMSLLGIHTFISVQLIF